MVEKQRLKMTELIFTLAGTLGFVVIVISFFALGANSVKPPSEIRLRLSSDKDGKPGVVVNAFRRSDGTYQTIESTPETKKEYVKVERPASSWSVNDFYMLPTYSDLEIRLRDGRKTKVWFDQEKLEWIEVENGKR